MLHLLVSSFHLTAHDAVTEPVVILIVFITTHDEHLHERHFFAKPSIKVLEGLSDGTRCNDGIRRTCTVRTAPGEVLELHSGSAGAEAILTRTSARTAANSGW